MKYVPKELSETADVSKGKQLWPDRLKFFASVVLIVGGGYVALGWVAAFAASQITDEQEAKWFKWEIGEIDNPSEEFATAKATFDKLKAHPSVRPLPYQLSLLEMPDANAFAVPGGNVGVTTGLLEVVPGEIGRAMVLGHELGHHAHRHTLYGLGRVLLQQLVSSLLFGGSGVSVFSSAEAFAQGQYSQKAEYEADAFGIKLVQDSYGTTEGALAFFESVQSMDAGTTKVGSWFRSHPLTADRIKRLQRMQRELAK